MKAVLFDMDGVLIDSELPAFRLLQNTLAQLGHTVELAELLDAYTGMSSSAIYATLVKRYGFSCTAEELRAQHHRISGDYYADAPLMPMPGLLPFLQALEKRGIGMAVVSSTKSVSVLTALCRLDLLRYFGAVVCGDMVRHPKPDPEGYQSAAGYLGVPAAECIAIEDSPVGIRAAKNAGIRVVGFKGSVHRQDTSAADMEAQSFEQLLKLLQERGSL